ncbi:MAG: 3-deoxy-7-phosphoheptulonate synthase, partial [Deltaproteobacteria bacterium]|nr:3-deoxy-7-phosphoheptulonate synthase [Deltaproteobacteria bacterium]
MLLVMSKNATGKEIDDVIGAIKQQGYIPRPIPGGERVSIGILYNKGPVDGSFFSGMPGVQDTIPVTKPYKLVSREFKPDETVVSVGYVKIGNGHMTIIAGPCAVESEKQAIT